MKKLPSPLIIEKNKLNAASPWLILLEITLVNPADSEDTSVFRFVRNTENITYDSQEYTAFPFEIEPTKYTSKGEIPTVTLRVSNITRIIQADLETYNGGVGSSVTVTVVHADNLSENYAELEMTFEVVACSTNAQWVVFTLGAPNPLRQRFPLDRYIPTHCCWRFKGVECGYAGEETECNHTYTTCVALGRQQSFGGFLGLRSGKLRVV